jgi:archaellum biogenesis ATPase FlaH
MPRILPSIEVDAIPPELRALPRWVCWQETANPNGGKPGKPPINPTVPFAGKHVFASCQEPDSWASFDSALRYWRAHLREQGPRSGLSFMLDGDGIIGIDLDKCRNVATKIIDEWALKIIKRFASYAEISPSGTGIRIFLRGTLPVGGRHKGQIEVYDGKKPLTVTGRKLSGHGVGNKIEDRSAELVKWHREVFGMAFTSTKGKESSNGHLVINDPPDLDRGRLNRLFVARPKAREIFEGRHDKPSQSEADLALANYATAVGWTEQETCDLLVTARQNAGESVKPVDYFTRTIAKARTPTPKPSPLEKLLRRAMRGTDDVEIGNPATAPDVQTASMADVARIVKGVRFLVPDWVPFGMVTMLMGEPGVGKSAFALYGLVRPIIGPRNWFNGRMGPSVRGYVLWCDCEGTAAITTQRIRDWKLPATLIMVPFHDDPLGSVNLADDGDLARIEALICKYRMKLVVVDSLRGAHDLDENNSKVGQVLQKLAKIAERTGAAVVVIHHTHKLGPDEEVTANASRGSNALVGLVRSQLGIDRPDKKSDWCRLRMLKENLGLKPEPIGFRITANGVEFGKVPEKPRPETERDRAETWLKKNMTPGQWFKAAELEEEAQQDGISEAALRRARMELDIVKPDHLRKTKDGWEWRLPAKASPKAPGES